MTALAQPSAAGTFRVLSESGKSARRRRSRETLTRWRSVANLFEPEVQANTSKSVWWIWNIGFLGQGALGLRVV